MLIWLIAFLLLVLIVWLPGGLVLPSMSGVAALAVSFPTPPLAPACCALPPRIARDTARIGHVEDEDRHGRAEGAGRAGDWPLTGMLAAAVMPNVRAARVVCPAGAAR